MRGMKSGGIIEVRPEQVRKYQGEIQESQLGSETNNKEGEEKSR